MENIDITHIRWCFNYNPPKIVQIKKVEQREERKTSHCLYWIVIETNVGIYSSCHFYDFSASCNLLYYIESLRTVKLSEVEPETKFKFSDNEQAIVYKMVKIPKSWGVVQKDEIVVLNTENNDLELRKKDLKVYKI